MAKDTVTSRPRYLLVLFSDDPKWERIGEAHLSYYASAYKRLETNQPQQDLFINKY